MSLLTAGLLLMTKEVNDDWLPDVLISTAAGAAKVEG